ncbi:plasmid pRiA4b ORF-3 family protein, partial [Flammeovirga aprica JL-4]|nr:plasmid pRiA4b ORF-3 family protein [Flammeovirga aprica JL-4]
MLEVLQDKSHEDYENYEGWTDEDFDPEHFSVEEVNERLRSIL